MTVLAVYTGTSYADLTSVGANVNAVPELSGFESRVAFEAQHGRHCLIAVDSHQISREGQLVLRWATLDDGAPSRRRAAPLDRSVHYAVALAMLLRIGKVRRPSLVT